MVRLKPYKMKKKQLINFLTTQNHYHIQDEGGSESEFRAGLKTFTRKKLYKLSRDGF